MTTPTTKQINDSIISQLESTLNQSISILPKSFLRVLSKTLAGVFVMVYKYAGFGVQQYFISTASDQPTEINGRSVVPLNEWGVLLGVGLPKSSTSAELVLEITVTNQSGSLPTGYQLVSSDTGVTYITTSAVLLNAATVSINVKSVADQSGGGGRGLIGNLNSGSTLSFANPIANVSRLATVTSSLVTGADGELTAAYRQRVLNRFQAPPQGRGYSDYRIWANQVEGVADSFPQTGNPGSVDVYVESSTEPNRVPTQAQLDGVLESINLNKNGIASRRPVNAFTNVLAVTVSVFDVSVVDLQVDDQATVRGNIKLALESYFLEKQPFIIGLSILPRSDRITQSGVAGIIEDVVNAAGGIFQSAPVTNNGSSVGTYGLGPGELSVLGSMSYIN